MTRNPGSACRRLRTAAQPPEWRGTRGPENPGAFSGAALPCFLSNQRPSNLKSPCDHSTRAVTAVNPERTDQPNRSGAQPYRRSSVDAGQHAAAALGSLGSPCGALAQVHASAKHGIVFHRQARSANIAFHHGAGA